MIETRIDDARERVRAEQDASAAKRDAIERFIDHVEGVSPDSTTAAQATASRGITTATQLRTGGSRTTGCAAVREAFAETIRAHSVADIETPEPLLETIKAELTESVAVALAPTTNTPLSPGLKRAIISESESRQTEIELMCRTLDRESMILAEAAETVEGITDWIAEADQTPLWGWGSRSYVGDTSDWRTIASSVNDWLPTGRPSCERRRAKRSKPAFDTNTLSPTVRGLPGGVPGSVDGGPTRSALSGLPTSSPGSPHASRVTERTPPSGANRGHRRQSCPDVHRRTVLVRVRENNKPQAPERSGMLLAVRWTFS
jgi:hypothetical protein